MERWVCVPTWVVDAEYYPKTDWGPHPYDLEEYSYFTRSGFHYLRFDAQTGAFRDPKDQERTRSDAPKVRGW